MLLLISVPPALWGACGLILGIIAYEGHYCVSFGLLGTLCVLMHTRWRIALYMIIFFMVGYSRIALYMHQYRSATRQLTSKQPLGGKAVVIKKDTRSITLKIKAYGSTVRIFTKKAFKVAPGDHVFFSDLEIRPEKNTQYLNYLYKEGITASVFSNRVKIRSDYRPVWSLTSIKQRVVRSVRSNLSHDAYTLFSALFLGTKTRGYGAMRRYFLWWGVVHYLARSGLHIIILLGIWRKLLWGVGDIILLVLYYTLTGPSVSFTRASCAYIIFAIFRLVRRSARPLQVIGLTGIAILTVNPLQLFYLDFQLSFLLTMVLMIYYEINHQIRVLSMNNSRSMAT